MTTARSEDIMTDFQFKAILKMVLAILESSDIEKTKKTIKDLIEGRTSAKDATDNEE
jgi:hypothetical protein